MTEKETVNEENAAFAEENAAFAEENAAFADENAAFADEAGSAAEEATAKEDTEAVSEETVEAGEAEVVEQAEAETSAEVEGEEKAEEATLAEGEAVFAEEAGSAAEEATAKEDTEAVEAGEAEAVEQAEAEASAEVEGEEKAEEATLAEGEAVFAEEAGSAAGEATTKEDTEAVSEEAVEAGETEAVEQAEAETSAEVESEEKAEEATLAEGEAVFAEEAGSAAGEATAKEDTEAVSEEVVEAGEAEIVEEAESEEKVAATSRTGVESEVIELSTESLKAFCGDITGMFGVEMKCKRQQVATETIEGLKKRFGSLVAVNSVKAEGALDGTFNMVFNREGLFTLAGLIVMPQQMTSLMEKAAGPEKILEDIKHGSLKEAEGMSDAMAEAGNMLVGAWNRVFREGLKDHGQFVQSNTFIGNPWDKPEEKIDLSGYEELLFVSYKMSIGPYPTFDCGVIFPRTVFAGAEEKARLKAEARARAEAEAKAKAEAEEKAKAEAEEKAKSEAEEKVKAETEAKAKSEAEEKVKAETEAKAKAEVEEKAKAEVEEKAATADETDESKEQPVSETIRKMTQSPAVLPGEPASSTTAESATVSGTHEILAMCAKDIMQKEVIWGSPDDSVQQTLTKMQQHDIGYMVAGLDGVMEGIVSKSDLTGAISPYLRPVFAKWRRPLDDATLQIKIKWIMSRPVRTVKPETSLAVIMENMRQFGGHCLAVVDEEGKVQGLVTVFDIFQGLLSSNPNVSSVGKTLQSPPLV